MSALDRTTLFDMVYDLAIYRGGEPLLGNTSEQASQAYRKSLIGETFPSFWMEAPLNGNPGFDLHVYYDRGTVRPNESFPDGYGFGMQGLFDWFFSENVGGVGIGFAHDLRDGSAATGAYVNFNGRPLSDMRGFFASLGKPESYEWASSLLERLPKGWHPWYVGLFPDRTGSPVRVGSFVGTRRQHTYARDPQALADDLNRAGFTAVDANMLNRLSQLAALPFTLELQLDVSGSGVGDTLGADLTLAARSAARVRKMFSDEGSATHACDMLEGWGVADDRWRAIAPTAMSLAVPLADDAGEMDAMVLSCLPSFIKAKWRAAAPLPAKVYLSCAARPLPMVR